MAKNIQVSATIIIIGNEILSGRTKDINTSTIATWLNQLGVRVQEVRVIPDVEAIIVSTINKLRKKYNYVFTTGGIGPTHDDITSQSISKAFGVKYGIHKKAYKILEDYYKKSEFSEGNQKHYFYKNSTQYISQFSYGYDARTSDHARVECMIMHEEDIKKYREFYAKRMGKEYFLEIFSEASKNTFKYLFRNYKNSKYYSDLPKACF